MKNSVVMIGRVSGIDFWMIFVPVSIAVLMLIGWFRYKMDYDETRRKYVEGERYGDKVIELLIIACGIAFGVMLLAESLDGTIQFVLDHFATSSSVADSKVMLIAVLLILLAVVAYILFVGLAVKMASEMKDDVIAAKIRKMRKKTAKNDVLDAWFRGDVVIK